MPIMTTVTRKELLEHAESANNDDSYTKRATCFFEYEDTSFRTQKGYRSIRIRASKHTRIVELLNCRIVELLNC